MQVDVSISDLCGDFLARVLGSGLRRCVQSQVRSPGDSLGHAQKNLVWRLPRARCRLWLETLRPVTGAKSQEIHMDMTMIHFCGVSVSLQDLTLSVSRI